MRILKENKRSVTSVSPNMELFLECVFMLLPGVGIGVSLDYSLLLAGVIKLSFIFHM